MGFHNHEWFTQALLDNSVWRIICSLSSLVARVLKESYFPDTSILEASVNPRIESLAGTDLGTQDHYPRIEMANRDR